MRQRDGRIPGLGGSLSSSEVLQRHLGMAHVVEVFSKITFWTSPRCPCGGRGRPWRPADRRGRHACERGDQVRIARGRHACEGGDQVPRRDRVRHRGRRYARLWRPPFPVRYPRVRHAVRHLQRPAGYPCRHSGNTRRTRRLIATGDQRSGDCADMAAGQLPVVVSMPRYSLNTCSDRELSTRYTVVSGPTKTLPRHARSRACAPRRRLVRLTSYAETTREAHR